jgi:dolichol-phosphate mannosyltransferase
VTATFDLVVPLWNEAANLDRLVAAIAESGLLTTGLERVILVDNGSQDATPAMVDHFASRFPWIQAEHLSPNRGYGGGILHGLRCSRAPYLAYIPGDNQVSCHDLALVWHSLLALRARSTAGARLLVKGWRFRRLDPLSMRVVSRVYTTLSNLLLHLRLRDVNALPKCFDRRLLDLLPAEIYTDFSIEPHLLTCARRHHFRIIEVPVVFHARREGVSSWSGRRLRVYWATFWRMYRLRALIRHRALRGLRLARACDCLPV